MITFLVCLALLVTAYFTYGRYLERLVGIDPAARTPCSRLYDGVDYVPLPRWRIFLIQLLNIAGLGPIFGAVLGAAYGPVAFLWITFGGIFMGAAHDFIAGVISLRHDGASLPETAGVYLGGGMKIVMRLFSAGLMILVGAVFLSQPASLVAARLDVPSLEGIAFGGFSWLLLIVLGVILVYYIAATLLPVDKIIGRIYPVFGFALLFMAVGILVVLLFGGEYTIPEFTSFENCIADAKAFPIVPMLFTTIACGAISGFHATQSPLMARCMRNERESRSVFYGAMISESIIALVWAAIAMAFWGNVGGLVAGFALRDVALIGRSMHDVVAEPYRKGFIPGYDALKEQVLAGGALAMNIAGSGPSVFALASNYEAAVRISGEMKRHFEGLGIGCNSYAGRVSNAGARVVE